MMLTSKFIMSEEGNKLGLIDAIVSKEELLTVARLWALDIAERRKPWISSLQRTDKLVFLAESRKVIQAAREQAKRTAPNMPQHQAFLDAVEERIIFGGYSGVLKSLSWMNKKNSWLFWWTLYLTAVAGIFLGIFSVIRFQPDYVLVV
ncbi:hypothetical protein C5167_036278 [Papaver somniferum]|uniref:peroxisomal fatty acid beta-oxidation multifunctional protein-like n=1 Tax=Papaver somniferum TaxID=3469 RepID=UPI000E6F4FA0|nr:peroxisomal fatty acid beta-oxidation multifunctional protein-like [Papaver somniferum]XP_026437237.1 peroxisomal fatty acid beta-oxidation multifunctional protein-like [Papaver somniferum]XP_026437238.1 peroxisomal fatty acid beta-oxidation multifunctional protein-like [Papaver somniferum]RZC89394.1 hypothetical protein C5167_036278 [Papaver somniferum]